MEMQQCFRWRDFRCLPEYESGCAHIRMCLSMWRFRDKIYSVFPGYSGTGQACLLGTGGSAMLLLSGGIDSPVGRLYDRKTQEYSSGRCVLPRAAVHQRNEQNRRWWTWLKLVARYSGPIRLHVVNFTDIQLYIYDKCPHEELTIIMRRYMMKIAEDICGERWLSGTDYQVRALDRWQARRCHSLAATNDVCTMPVFRPVIGFDKQEIVDVASKNQYL